MYASGTTFNFQPCLWRGCFERGPRAAAESYALANMVIDFLILPELTLSASGTNLTDEQYTYPESVRPIVDTLPGGPGRAFYGRLVADF